MIYLTNKQARQFILLKHGLLGSHRFIGKQGVLEFVEQFLYELLYVDRKLIDYPDKNLAILSVEDWPYFARYRKAAEEGGLHFIELAELEKEAKRY